jgi:predicted anti-sigma-YlaC factor YlaD
LMTMPWPAELNHLPVRHLRALVNCDAMSEELPLVVDGSRRPSPAMAEHLHTCLRCQAELAGYGRLLRVLRALRDEPVSFPPPDLVGDALRALQERIGVFQENVSARSRRASETWLLAGAVAGLGVFALGARAFMARGSRQSRATRVATVVASSYGG